MGSRLKNGATRTQGIKMKTKHKALTAISLAMMCGSAAAVEVVDTTPTSSITITSSSPYTITHDITDTTFTIGSIITAATLSFKLSDDVGNEVYSMVIGNNAQTWTDPHFINNSSHTITTEPFDLNAAALADLMADGKLSVSFQASSGDYQFVSSTLTAQITPVPEPEMLAMLVPGLLLIGAMKRRSRQA